MTSLVQVNNNKAIMRLLNFPKVYKLWTQWWENGMQRSITLLLKPGNNKNNNYQVYKVSKQFVIPPTGEP